MCDDLGTWNLGLPLEEELARTWQDDMIWWGPTGIGATYTIERYAKQHSGPSEPPLPIDRLAGIYAEYQKVIMVAFSAGQTSRRGILAGLWVCRRASNRSALT